MFLQFKVFNASSVWEFKDPDTGYLYKASNRGLLLSNIISYRIQNNLEPLEELNTIVDNYLCHLPENKGKCKHLKYHRNFFAYIKGGIALLMNLYYGEKNMVLVQEADRRAEICLACPHNIFPDKDMFVKWADEIAFASVGSRRSTHHDKLGNCEVCSCPIRAKVFWSGKNKLDATQVSQMRKVACWQLDNR